MFLLTSPSMWFGFSVQHFCSAEFWMAVCRLSLNDRWSSVTNHPAFAGIWNGGKGRIPGDLWWSQFLLHFFYPLIRSLCQQRWHTWQNVTSFGWKTPQLCIGGGLLHIREVGKSFVHLCSSPRAPLHIVSISEYQYTKLLDNYKWRISFSMDLPVVAVFTRFAGLSDLNAGRISATVR